MAGLFGTDGIRGQANREITPELALGLGKAIAQTLAAGSKVVIGRDTRRSGEMLSAAVAAGLTSTGVDAADLGVVTTPCLAYATTRAGTDGGVMVSASHNPAPDNGLKVIVAGRKLDDADEEELERLMAAPEELRRPPNAGLGRMRSDQAAIAEYQSHLAAAAGGAFAGLRIGIDCANGSASAIAPDLFRALGAEVTVLFAAPDGDNINDGCGSTDPRLLAETVIAARLDLGLAFDGDVDRLIAIDERGELVDGDAIMGICALARLASGRLHNNVVVATVMSNGGLERALASAGARLVRTPVGDRHVLEAMEREGADIGGEQSGHVIFRERSTTGDGLLTAIELVSSMRAGGARPLSELAAQIPRLPQVMLNSAVRRREEWETDDQLAAAVKRAEEHLAGRGRILVRPSGTEPRLRIMVEGDDHDEIDAIARELAGLAEARLN